MFVPCEQTDYEAKLAQRAERERTTGRRSRPGGRSPTPPVPGARSGDQYNFTDPQSRIMKSSTHAGFEQDYNAQVAVDQGSLRVSFVESPAVPLKNTCTAGVAGVTAAPFSPTSC